MQILLSQNQNHYLATVDGEEFALPTPVTTRLIILYTALRRKYPEATIKISHEISRNPFIHAITMSPYFPVASIEVQRISRMMEFPPISCSVCKHEAWWDYNVQTYHCPHCDCVDISRTGKFLKMRSHFFTRPHHGLLEEIK